MARTIPVDGTLPHSKLRVSLDGTTFGLEFRWNHRMEAWFFSVFSADGTLLLANRRVALSPTGGRPFLLLGRFRDPRLPRGDFVAIDTTSTDREARLGDLGTRVLFVYLTVQELLGESA